MTHPGQCSQAGNINAEPKNADFLAALKAAELALNGIRCHCRCTAWGDVGPALATVRAAIAEAIQNQQSTIKDSLIVAKAEQA